MSTLKKRIKDLSATAARKPPNILIYGDSGTGKTTLAGSCQRVPSMQNVLMLDVEGGGKTLVGVPGIRSIDIQKVSDLEEIAWAFRRKDPAVKGVRTVVIDTVTELQSIDLLEGVQKKGRSNLDELYQEDYGRSTMRLRRIFRMFKDLDVAMVAIAHTKRVFPPVVRGQQITITDPISVIPALTTKLSTAFVGMMDWIWYTYQDEEDGSFHMVTKQQGAYFAKTRQRRFQEALGTDVKNPSMPKIMKIWHSVVGGTTEADNPKPATEK